MSSVVPTAPPVEVLDAVRAAADFAARMAVDGRELHFSPDPHGGRITIEVRDLDGSVIATLTPSQALDLLPGWPAPRVPPD